MPNELAAVVVLVAAWVVTYLLHSTVSLGAAWLGMRLSRVTNPTLLERTWKVAAVLPMLTASLQGGVGWSRPLCEISVVSKPGLRTAAPETAFDALISGPGRVAVVDGSEPPAIRVARSGGSLRSTPATPLSVEANPNVTNDWPTSIEPTSEPRTEFVLRQDAKNGIASQTIESSPAPVRVPALDGVLNEVENVAWSPVCGVDSKRLVPESLEGAIVVSGLALCFGMFGILSLILQTIRLKRRLKDATVISEGPVRKSLDRLLQRAHLRRSVRLIAGGADAEPVALGLWHWTIVLPEGIETRMRNDELTALLAHELAHLVRGDIVWLWIGRMLCAGLAFQPLNWIARRRWQQAAELLCDNWAVRQSVSPFALARCLTQVAEWRLADHVCPASLAATGAGTSLSRRVERLLDGSHRDDRWATTWRRHVVTTAVIVSFLAINLWAPRAVTTTQVSAADSIRRAEPRISINNPSSAIPEVAEWQKLLAEWSILQADFIRMTELLAFTSDAPEVRDSLTTIRQRVLSVEQRIQESIRQETESQGRGKSEP